VAWRSNKIGNHQLTNLRVQKRTRMNLKKVTITMTIQSISNLKMIKEKQKHKLIEIKSKMNSVIQVKKGAG